MYCSVLQCVAVCGSVWQCDVVRSGCRWLVFVQRGDIVDLMCFRVLQGVAVCCSVLQCVAVCRSVSQCVAVCRSVWPSFAAAVSLYLCNEVT